MLKISSCQVQTWFAGQLLKMCTWYKLFWVLIVFSWTICELQPTSALRKVVHCRAPFPCQKEWRQRGISGEETGGEVEPSVYRATCCTGLKVNGIVLQCSSECHILYGWRILSWHLVVMFYNTVNTTCLMYRFKRIITMLMGLIKWKCFDKAEN